MEQSVFKNSSTCSYSQTVAMPDFTIRITNAKGGSTRYRWPVPSSYTAATSYEKLNAHLTFFAV